jgi:hypothetical protein
MPEEFNYQQLYHHQRVKGDPLAFIWIFGRLLAIRLKDPIRKTTSSHIDADLAIDNKKIGKQFTSHNLFNPHSRPRYRS